MSTEEKARALLDLASKVSDPAWVAVNTDGAYSELCYEAAPEIAKAYLELLATRKSAGR